MNKKYEDMLDMEHHVSKKHPRMSMHDRAAQFSPFAALTGYDKRRPSFVYENGVNLVDDRIMKIAKDELLFIDDHIVS